MTARLKGGGVWIEPGEYLILFDEFERAIPELRRGRYRVAKVGKTPVIEAILVALIPDLEVLKRARREDAEREAARVAERGRRESRAQEAEAARARHEIKTRTEEAARVRDAQVARDEAERRRLDEEARAKRKVAFLNRLKAHLETGFLSVDGLLTSDPDADLLTAVEFEALKVGFVRDWVGRELALQLDADQAGAIATVGRDVKVIARAGSGKTRTLTTRALFLQRHCGVSPKELLLLAFNRDAAMEMRARVQQVVGEDLPHVMTFHSLAYALVHPEADLLSDDAAAGTESLSREIQEVIDEHIRAPSSRDTIREVMLAHFRDDWERIRDGQIELTIDDFLAYRRALPRESLRGEYVKSFGEREIANTLFEHAVEYSYERNHRWNGVNYKPDFTIATPAGGVVVEYFGLKGDPDYDEMSADKRGYWASRRGWTLLEYTPRDLVRGGIDEFRKRLVRDLVGLGLATRRRSEEEIWQEVRQRAIDQFTKTMTGFVGRGRKLGLAPDSLRSMIATHNPATRSEALFLEVAESVYRGYLRRLTALKKDDFDGLMWRAAAEVTGGQTRFVRDRGREHGDLTRLKYVLVDEFQDFSQMFYELLSGMRKRNPQVEFFCVGDDWQAINAFAGADLRFFADFPTYFPKAAERQITTNYRSTAPVVHAGNALMFDRGVPAKPRKDNSDSGTVWLCKLDAFSPTVFEQDLHKHDELTPAVLRLVRRFLDDGKAVVMLSRRNSVRGYVNYAAGGRRLVDGLERFLTHVRSFLPKEDHERVTISTTHKYKGREQEAVIVLDAVEGAYPLIHPSWVFLRLFGDSLQRIEDDERRLFYVAITRARSSLALITETRRVSPYVSDVERSGYLRRLDWSELPAVPSLDGPRLEIRVYDNLAVRDRLKDLDYRWHQDGLYWSRTAAEEGFSFDALLAQDWTEACGRIVVLAPSGDIVHERSR